VSVSVCQSLKESCEDGDTVVMSAVRDEGTQTLVRSHTCCNMLCVSV